MPTAGDTTQRLHRPAPQEVVLITGKP